VTLFSGHDPDFVWFPLSHRVFCVSHSVFFAAL
jgi:hypothetical protein